MEKVMKIWVSSLMVVLIACGAVWADPTDGLIGHWKLDEGSGTTAYDSAGTNHGTLVDGPTWTTGQVEGALDFDGDDDYVSVPDDPVWDTGSEITVSAWVYLNQVKQYTAIAVHDLSDYKWLLYSTLGGFDFYVRTASGFTSTGVFSSEAGKWYHVVGVYDRSETNRVKLYVDGMLERNAIGYDEDISDGDEGVYVGTGYNFLHNGFKGIIDDVRIYDRALSAGEVEQLYQDGLAELVGLEIVGPNEVAEDSLAQYKAIAHYENNGTRDVTASADWSVEPNDIADIDAGLLETKEIYESEDISIYAQYTEGEVTVEAEKAVSIFAICPSGTALSFDGVDDYVEVNDSTSLDIVDEITIAAWIYTTGLETGVIAMKKEGDCLQYGFGLDQDRLSFDYRTQCGSGAYYQHTYKSDSSISSNTWHHVAVRYESGNSASATLYLDGVEIPGSWTLGNGSGEMASMPSYLTIGRTVTDGGTPQAHFKGTIDDVRIYNQALSAEEIVASMHTKLAGDEDGLVAYWDFDEGEGEITGDLSGNGNDGTIVGAEWVQSDAPIGICTPVAVDIKPGSCPNPLNLSSQGVLPVAILGSQDFDVSTIDAVSVELAGVGAIRHSYEDVASPVTDGNECECTTEGPDGYLDLTLKFGTQEIVEQLIYSQDELAKDQTLVLTLTGELFDDIGIEGTDCVVLVGNVPKWLAARRWDANGDGVVNMADFAIFADNWLEEE